MICNKCTRFVRNWQQFASSTSTQDDISWCQYEETIHGNIDELKQASEQHCQICRNIWFSLSEKEQDKIFFGTDVILKVDPDQGKPHLKVVFMRDGQPEFGPRMFAMFHQENESGEENLSVTFQFLTVM
jgi:hypothetical protein